MVMDKTRQCILYCGIINKCGTHHCYRVHGIYNCEEQNVIRFGLILPLSPWLVGRCVVSRVPLQKEKIKRELINYISLI